MPPVSLHRLSHACRRLAKPALPPAWARQRRHALHPHVEPPAPAFSARARAPLALALNEPLANGVYLRAHSCAVPAARSLARLDVGRLRLTRPLVIFDLETTGLGTKTARIVEFAALKLYPDGAADMLHSLVDPQCRIPSAASRIHGIDSNRLRQAHAPTLHQCAAQLQQYFAGCDVAGHNARAYDVPLLRHEMARVGQPQFFADDTAVVDTYRLFRHCVDKQSAGGNFRLVTAYAFYCNKSLAGAHSAVADTEACAQVLLAQLQRHPGALPPAVAQLARL